MRMRFVVPIALALILPMVAGADDAASVKKKAEANYAKMKSAFTKKDLKGYMSAYADNFAGVGMMGQKAGKAQAEVEMKQHIADTQKINSAGFKVSDVKVKGDKATGKVDFHLDCVTLDSMGMMGAKGKSHRLVMDDQQNVTWTKAGGKWLIVKEAPTGISHMSVDGKPFNPGAPPTPPKKK